MTIQEQFDIMWKVYLSIRKRDTKEIITYIRVDKVFNDDYELVIRTLLEGILNPFEVKR